MNEHRLRAWDIENKVMHYDFEYITVKDKGELVIQSDILPLDFSKWPPEYEIPFGKFYVNRYLYVNDKNHKRIYDLDIISVTESDGEVWVGSVGCTEYGCAGIWEIKNRETGHNRFSFFDKKGITVEVIGNVFENPELHPDFELDKSPLV